MASKIIKIKVSKASKLQIQTLLLEIGLIAKQWFRKVKVKIEITKQNMLDIYPLIVSNIIRKDNYANNTSYIFLGNHYNVNDCYIFIKKYMETDR